MFPRFGPVVSPKGMNQRGKVKKGMVDFLFLPRYRTLLFHRPCPLFLITYRSLSFDDSDLLSQRNRPATESEECHSRFPIPPWVYVFLIVLILFIINCRCFIFLHEEQLKGAKKNRKNGLSFFFVRPLLIVFPLFSSS